MGAGRGSQRRANSTAADVVVFEDTGPSDHYLITRIAEVAERLKKGRGRRNEYDRELGSALAEAWRRGISEGSLCTSSGLSKEDMRDKIADHLIDEGVNLEYESHRYE